MSPQAIEAVLADFRRWLESLASQPSDGEGPPPGPTVDLHTLVGQFVALRHEVNLQTRATRAQQEQNLESLRLLEETLDELRQGREEAASARSAAPPSTDEERVRPLIKTLVDSHDALSLARREIQRSLAALEAPPSNKAPRCEETLAPRSEAVSSPRPSWWARLLGRGSPTEEHVEETKPDGAIKARARQVIDSLLSGYSMSLQRLERSLAQQGLEPIASVGQPFDPERMEVLEVTGGSGRPPGEVLEEIRRGYLWQGRIFRYAQVRVARE